VKTVHAELIGLLGGETLKITYASQPPTVVLMAGLQGGFSPVLWLERSRACQIHPFQNRRLSIRSCQPLA
jgi:hypothetical protein